MDKQKTMTHIEVFHSKGSMAEIQKDFTEFTKKVFNGDKYYLNIYYPANFCFRLYLEELKEAFYAGFVHSVEVEFFDGKELKMTFRIMAQSPDRGKIALNHFMDFISDGNGYIVDGSKDCFVLEKSESIFCLPQVNRDHE